MEKNLAQGFYDECSEAELQEHAITIEQELQELDDEEAELALQRQVLLDHQYEVKRRLARHAFRLIQGGKNEQTTGDNHDTVQQEFHTRNRPRSLRSWRGTNTGTGEASIEELPDNS